MKRNPPTVMLKAHHGTGTCMDQLKENNPKQNLSYLYTYEQVQERLKNSPLHLLKVQNADTKAGNSSSTSGSGPRS